MNEASSATPAVIIVTAGVSARLRSSLTQHTQFFSEFFLLRVVGLIVSNPGHNATGQNAADKNSPGQNARRRKRIPDKMPPKKINAGNISIYYVFAQRFV